MPAESRIPVISVPLTSWNSRKSPSCYSVLWTLKSKSCTSNNFYCSHSLVISRLPEVTFYVWLWNEKTDMTLLAYKDCGNLLMHSFICHPHAVLTWDACHVLSEHLIPSRNGKWVLLKEYLSKVTFVFMTLADSYMTSVLSENLSRNGTVLLLVTCSSEFQRLQNDLPFSKGEEDPCLFMWCFFKGCFWRNYGRVKNSLGQEEKQLQYLLE